LSVPEHSDGIIATTSACTRRERRKSSPSADGVLVELSGGEYEFRLVFLRRPHTLTSR
jgi:hypothetical protein